VAQSLDLFKVIGPTEYFRNDNGISFSKSFFEVVWRQGLADFLCQFFPASLVLHGGIYDHPIPVEDYSE
jgi:hypothetical protein